MRTEIRMAIMSHLSDAQHLAEMGMIAECNKEINFAKYLLIKHRDHLNEERSWDDLDKDYAEMEQRLNSKR